MYAYDTPQNLSMVAEAPIPYGDRASSKGVFSSIPLTPLCFAGTYTVFASSKDGYMQAQESYQSLFEDTAKYNAIMSALAEFQFLIRKQLISQC